MSLNIIPFFWTWTLPSYHLVARFDQELVEILAVNHKFCVTLFLNICFAPFYILYENGSNGIFYPKYYLYLMCDVCSKSNSF